MILCTLVHVSRPNLLILSLHLYVVIFHMYEYVSLVFTFDAVLSTLMEANNFYFYLKGT